MLASLKGELQVASTTGVFLFHQELVECTSGLVVKDFILFSNIFFFCLSRSGFGRSVPRLTPFPQPVQDILALALPSVFTSFT